MEQSAASLVPANDVPTKASLLSLTLNLITGALGSGILSVPWGMAGASMIGSILIVAVVLALNAWTNMILVNAGDKYKKFNLGSLLGDIPGPLGTATRATCEVMIYVSIFGCLVGYMIIVADSLTPLLHKPSFWPFDGRSFWITLGSLIVLPLCLLPQKYLSISSSLCIAVNIYIVCLLIYLLGQQGPTSRVCAFGVTSGFVTMVSATMQCCIISMCILPMYEELERRTPKRFRLAIVTGFSFVFVIFAGFASLGYFLYGAHVESNILKNLPQSPGGDVARGGMVLVVAGVYPIMIQSMIAPVREFVKASGRSKAWVQVATATIVFCAMGVSFGVTDLGIMNTINGAVCVFFFVGLAPGMAGIFLLYRGDSLRRNTMIVLIVLCFAASVAGFFFLDNDYAKLLISCNLWVER
mmetsp:Transcript_7179/g.11681  ORF Transcript_7179/g.11681 Transcript_7179/m.11681 type:complete len:412 (-) Transcript_7179:42-1277(-)